MHSPKSHRRIIEMTLSELNPPDAAFPFESVDELTIFVEENGSSTAKFNDSLAELQSEKLQALMSESIQKSLGLAGTDVRDVIPIIIDFSGITHNKKPEEVLYDNATALVQTEIFGASHSCGAYIARFIFTSSLALFLITEVVDPELTYFLGLGTTWRQIKWIIEFYCLLAQCGLAFLAIRQGRRTVELRKTIDDVISRTESREDAWPSDYIWVAWGLYWMDLPMIQLGNKPIAMRHMKKVQWNEHVFLVMVTLRASVIFLMLETLASTVILIGSTALIGFIVLIFGAVMACLFFMVVLFRNPDTMEYVLFSGEDPPTRYRPYTYMTAALGWFAFVGMITSLNPPIGMIFSGSALLACVTGQVVFSQAKWGQMRHRWACNVYFMHIIIGAVISYGTGVCLLLRFYFPLPGFIVLSFVWYYVSYHLVLQEIMWLLDIDRADESWKSWCSVLVRGFQVTGTKMVDTEILL